MINKIRNIVSHNIYNIQGWRTKRKIVVIESDDWGSIRMPDKDTYNKLIDKGIRVDKCPYNRYDSLAGEDDLNALFEVLYKFRDFKGNHPIVTANCVMANPDFDKIRNSGFNEYHYEIFTETLKKYPRHSQSFEYWKQGIDNKLFYPQFHGREHLNVARWMNALNLHLPETHIAFELKMFGLSTNITCEKRKSYLEAFAADNISEETQINNIIAEGLTLFSNTFGYRSKSIIAPNYVWSSINEEEFYKQGVKYIQGQRKQISKDFTQNRVKLISHHTGDRNIYGQVYTVRNCMFEPSLYGKTNNTHECISHIKSAFTWNKPAIISSHRVNFIGSIELSNRNRNLQQFNELLSVIIKRWPDVEFMTTETLGDLISNETRYN